MATNGHHHASRSSLAMSYSQNSIRSANGLSLSQSHMGSFNTSQSVGSTPAATPPRGSQQSAMSFNYQNGVNHGSMQRGSFGGYDAPNGYGTMMSYQEDYKPQIYRAVYSNVSVYEMEVNGVAVMKRRSDSWLNATQILKVAGIVKARRTKTLEKEIAAGQHEKVQGGYGKYQGTWVNYQRGVELCREYNVEELLRPLLEYDMGGDGLDGTGQGPLDTPTKEQAMAAQRKRLYNNDSRGVGPPPQGTFFQNISRTAANAVNAMSKARFDSPAGRGTDSRRSSFVRKSSQQTGSQELSGFPNSQQSNYSVSSDSGFASHPHANNQQMNNSINVLDQDEMNEPPRKRMRSASTQGRSFGANNTISTYEPTPTEPSDSFYQQTGDPGVTAVDENYDLDPLPPATTPDRFQKMKLIMTLFLDKRTKDFSNHPALAQLKGEDLEIPLDEFSNNALHWAAMLARLPLVHALVEKGVSIFRLNLAGETALQKAVGTRNNLDYRSFPRLLQILAPTIGMVDHSGRTILHHIAVMAATGGGGHVSAKHYLESLLEFIVRQGGTEGTNGNSVDGTNGHMDHADEAMSKHQIISLGKFISDIVNLRDDQGDTALNLAGRARSVLVPQLLEIGADPHIPNHTGLRPADYGVGVDMVNENSQSHQNGEKKDSFIDQLAKIKKEILDATLSQIGVMVEETLGGIDRDLTSDLSKKQAEYDHWHAKIRESAKARQVEQSRLGELKRKASERVELDRRIKNLERDTGTLSSALKDLHGEKFDISRASSLGDADRDSGVDVTEFDRLFSEDFDPAGRMSAEQTAFLTSLPAVEILQTRVKCYRKHNEEIVAEVDRLKSKNVVLGENYRRMVMACTGWTAEQVDDAAEGLTQCVKELNDNPVPEDEAIEILMQDRGQDW